MITKRVPVVGGGSEIFKMGGRGGGGGGYYCIVFGSALLAQEFHFLEKI